MKFYPAFCVCLVAGSAAFCQSSINTELQKQIRAMFKEDQKWRIESININNGKKSAFDEETVNRKMGQADSLNLIAAKNIVAHYGYPGYKLVDTSGSNGFWAIIQHCDEDVPFQQRVLLLLAKEVKRHNASGENYALLQDRVLVNTGHKQLYGTQVRVDLKTHHARPLPISDSLQVDARRKSVGLPPLTAYLKSYDPKE